FFMRKATEFPEAIKRRRSCKRRLRQQAITGLKPNLDGSIRRARESRRIIKRQRSCIRKRRIKVTSRHSSISRAFMTGKDFRGIIKRVRICSKRQLRRTTPTLKPALDRYMKLGAALSRMHVKPPNFTDSRQNRTTFAGKFYYPDYMREE